jgi:hypothetical protein
MPIHHDATGSLIGPGSKVTIGSDAIELLTRAHDFLIGVEALAAGPVPQVPACRFLASWTLELALKSYLSHAGVDSKQLKSSKLRHNLSALWEKAAHMGLPIDDKPPRWCNYLSGAHDYPYQERYPTTSAALVQPSVVEIASKLGALINLVKGFVLQ